VVRDGDENFPAPHLTLKTDDTLEDDAEWIEASQAITPERFNRGCSRIPPGFPLKACGNDELVSSRLLSSVKHRALAAVDE
jgi:hypothetical protein